MRHSGEFCEQYLLALFVNNRTAKSAIPVVILVLTVRSSLVRGHLDRDMFGGAYEDKRLQGHRSKERRVL